MTKNEKYDKKFKQQAKIFFFQYSTAFYKSPIFRAF